MPVRERERKRCRARRRWMEMRADLRLPPAAPAARRRPVLTPLAETTPLVAKKAEERHGANKNSARSATDEARRAVPAEEDALVPRLLAKAGAAKAGHGWPAMPARRAMPGLGRPPGTDHPPSTAKQGEERDHANQNHARSATLVCRPTMLTGSDHADPANSKPRQEPRRFAMDGLW